MSLMWYHHGDLKVTSDVFYETGIQIGEKLYLVGVKILAHGVPGVTRKLYGTILSELNFKTMTIHELKTIDEMDLQMCHVFAYGEDIIIFTHGSNNSRHIDLKFVKINPRTDQVKNRTLRHEILNSQVIDACAIEDNFYIVFRSCHIGPCSKVVIVAVNLTTWRKEMIEEPTASQVINRPNLRAIAHGKDIFLISCDDLYVSIFSTETKEWTKFENHLGSFDPNNIIRGISIYINNEVFHFKYPFTGNLNEKNLIDILNCNSMKWRKEKLSLPSVFNVYSCCYPFVFQGKIFIIRHPIQRIRDRRHDWCCLYFRLIGNESGPKLNVIYIYELDLNPSLERLCFIKVIQNLLPLDEVPQFVREEIKRYIK